MQKKHTHTYIKGNRKFFFFFFKIWFQNKNWAMLQFQKDPNEIEAKFQNKNRRLPKVSTTVHLKRVCRQFPSMTPSHDQKKKKKHSLQTPQQDHINKNKETKKEIRQSQPNQAPHRKCNSEPLISVPTFFISFTNHR